ncbi:HutP family protein [Candidatus Riflebacteria bacterium]
MISKLKELMSSELISIEHNGTLSAAREQMILGQEDYVFVVKNKKVVGLLTKSDLLLETDMKKHVSEIMSTDIVSVSEDSSIQEAARLIDQHDVDHLPVYDKKNVLLGVLSSKNLIHGWFAEEESKASYTLETACIKLAMTKSKEEEEAVFKEVVDSGFKAAVTQVGCNAERFPIKLREATIVACIARKTIKEETREKIAVSDAIRTVINQFFITNPGLGGGFKVAVTRGSGRIVVTMFGKSGHALANSPEQIFMGYSII